jgi:hypothetical protein
MGSVGAVVARGLGLVGWWGEVRVLRYPGGCLMGEKWVNLHGRRAIWLGVRGGDLYGELDWRRR